MKEGDHALILVADACTNASFLATVLFIRKLVKIISIIIPILLVLLVTIDMLKAVMASDDNQIKKVQSLAIKRIIWALVIFFVPIVVNATLSLFEGKEVAGITCYNNATDGVVDALQQAEKESLLKYEEDKQRLIDLAKESQEAYERELERLRELAESQGGSGGSATPATLKAWFNALEEQYKWAKNSSYRWVNPPTIENSKRFGTCATYPSVSLQRAGLLPKGKFIYVSQEGKGRLVGTGSDYVKKHPEIFTYSSPHATPVELDKKNQLKPGDIVGFDRPVGGHMMIFVGKDSKGNFLWDTGGHTKCINCKMNNYLKRKVRLLVRIKSIK